MDVEAVEIDFNPMQINSILFSAEEPTEQRVDSKSSENLELMLSNNSDILACISPEKVRDFEN
jgi:hypothetical protein